MGQLPFHPLAPLSFMRSSQTGYVFRTKNDGREWIPGRLARRLWIRELLSYRAEELFPAGSRNHDVW